MSDQLQGLWDSILSEDPQRILTTYNTLEPNEQQYLLVHLYKMINEPGWHPNQVQTAQKAIEVIEGIQN